MNPGLSKLRPYPFERLGELIGSVSPAPDKRPIDVSIGEPTHATPPFIHAAMTASLATTARYPATRGTPSLRAAIADWLTRRYRLPSDSVDADAHVLPLNGTREGLFSIAQCCIDRHLRDSLVAMFNPCYQIYEGAALLAGAAPYFMNLMPEAGYAPDICAVPTEIWRRCQLLYLCSPHNPTGTILDVETLQAIISLAVTYDFVIVSDECYSELYYDESAPPPGLLQAAAALENHGFSHCLVVHSLSKRSNVPGLRSGFVAGDPQLIADFYRYRTYHGSAMPLYSQQASEAAWRDETHVAENRALYRRKYDAVLPLLPADAVVAQPQGGFYLWLRLPVDDQTFTRRLYAEENVKVVPGSYLAHTNNGVNPGARHVRIALVPALDVCVEAVRRIADLLQRT